MATSPTVSIDIDDDEMLVDELANLPNWSRITLQEEPKRPLSRALRNLFHLNSKEANKAEQPAAKPDAAMADAVPPPLDFLHGVALPFGMACEAPIGMFAD